MDADPVSGLRHPCPVRLGSGGVAGTPDVVWRNATSGKLVVWHLDHAGNRTGGVFTSPDAPSPPLDWTLAGPR